ncbi:hypothetical protein GY45DRAFT_965509 [Cubamyces sp. BRFM 1775]|nr:hypothetical protein GY45DRAFT_965509 [Cubamyces sp. BRFM 1775]
MEGPARYALTTRYRSFSPERRWRPMCIAGKAINLYYRGRTGEICDILLLLTWVTMTSHENLDPHVYITLYDTMALGEHSTRDIYLNGRPLDSLLSGGQLCPKDHNMVGGVRRSCSYAHCIMALRI